MNRSQRPPFFAAAGATDPWTGIRLTRLGVALNSLVLALEAAAYEASDGAGLDPTTWSYLAMKVPERLAACAELLETVRTTRLGAGAERAAAMRQCFETMRREYEAFRSAADRPSAARALLVTLRAVKESSDAWSE